MSPLPVNPCKPALRSALDVLAWLALFIVVVAAIQLAIPYPLDDDTAYHFSVARLLREHGILYSFPWTRFSWQFDHYADKEFLFHLLFVPFTGLGFVTASRIVGIICGTAVITAIYCVLRSERVKYAGFWALLPLGTVIFAYRFSQVRPHLLSMALAIILIWAYCRRRTLPLFAAALLYPLCYVAFWQIPLIMVAAAEAARLAGGERFNWRLPLVVAAGVAAGLCLHPNTLNLLQMNWIHMTDILFRNAWGEHVEFNMGEEFEPFSPAEWGRFLLVTGLVAWGTMCGAWRKRRENQLATALGVAVAIFFLLTLRTNRFLEYLVPLAFLTLPLVTGFRARGWLLPSLAATSLVYFLLGGIGQLRYMTSAEQRLWQMAEPVSGRFRQEIPVGANVFTCGWEYTGTLMVNLPDRNYLVALDPTLLYKRDPALYDLWYRTLLYAPADAAATIRDRFGSRYVACLDHPTLHPFFDALAADSGVKVLYSDGKWVLFALDGVVTE